jgi:hypothetical protein
MLVTIMLAMIMLDTVMLRLSKVDMVMPTALPSTALLMVLVTTIITAPVKSIG